jgi:hypothetical protein
MKKRPLFDDDDPDEWKRNITRLIKLGYFVRRCGPNHVRIERVNFWPTTGSIQIDGQARRPERGWEALLALLTAVCPRPARTRSHLSKASTRPNFGGGSPIDPVDVKVVVLDLGESVTMPPEKVPTEITLILPDTDGSSETALLTRR